MMGDQAQGNSIDVMPAAQDIQAWLIAQLAARIGIAPAGIDARASFASYGLTSQEIAGLSGEMERWLNRRLSPTLAYDYPTIAALAHYLAGEHHPAPPIMAERAGVTSAEPIAIIGIGCRFPGANSVDAFWRLLHDGVDAITEVPADRWDVQAFYDPSPMKPGKLNTRWGGFIDQIDRFDPGFFGISRQEAAHIDPQQRLLLEIAWEALEDAGQTPQSLAGTPTGVFVGITLSEYGALQLRDPALVNLYAGTGSTLCIAANRISYFFDFRGPSLAVDTACSSSLVAIHLACRSLAAGESTLALAGGANLILSPALTVNFSLSGATSPVGRCKAFDAAADGIVRSEGVGLVVLKPLSLALADGDSIYALIRGGAVSQDGRTNGITAPNRLAQEAVLREAYRAAGVSPSQIQYIEAHGTGTLLGDPIEAGALGNVLSTDRPTGDRCVIGSVKTNIGHTEAAAGIAGLIKVALALRHGEIPPSLHFHTPNPHIPFDDLPLRVQQVLGPWPRRPGPALAGVSSFGFGGTNAHIVVEGPPDMAGARQGAAHQPDRAELLPLSAHSQASLRDLARAYQTLLSDDTRTVWLYDLGYTASVRRAHHDHRIALLAHSRSELIEGLQAFLDRASPSQPLIGGQVAGQRRRVVFVFSGHGAQWWAMGRELLLHEPIFRASIEQCDLLLRRYVRWSLLEELTADEAESLLDTDRLEIVQTAIFAVQVGLAALWRAWGVEPDAVVGHSLGEVAAAYVAGVFSLDDAIRIIFHRSHLMEQVPRRAAVPGAMAMVELSKDAAIAALVGYEGRLSLASYNAPTSTVISGDADALERLLGSLQQREVFCRVLHAPGAGHSPQVETICDELVQALHGLAPQRGACPIYSTVTGHPDDGLEFDARYWGRNIREPVLFADAIERLALAGYDTFLEISPHPILSPAIAQSLQPSGRQSLVLPSLRRKVTERDVMLSSLGALYVAGYPVDWRRLYPDGGQSIRLPTYIWQRERFWIEEPHHRRVLEANEHPLLGRRLRSAVHPATAFWETDLDQRALPYLSDHRVRGRVVLPAAVYLEMALAAAAQLFGQGPHLLEHISFSQALLLSEGSAQALQLVVEHTGAEEASLRFFTPPPAGAPQQAAWALHASGAIRRGPAGLAPLPSAAADRAEIRARCSIGVSAREFYQAMRRREGQYGPMFQGVAQLWRRDGEALGQLRLPEAVAQAAGSYLIHPALLDACFQVLAAALPEDDRIAPGDLYLPVGLEALRLWRAPGASTGLWSHAILRAAADANTFLGDISLLDQEGHVVLEIQGLRFQLLDRDAYLNEDDWLYVPGWELQARPALAAAQVASSAGRPGGWVIFADDQGIAEQVQARLLAQGEICVMVSPGDRYVPLRSGHVQLNPARPADFQRLFEEALAHEPSASPGVIYLWGMDGTSAPDGSLAALEAAQQLGCGSLLHIVQALARRSWNVGPRLWLVTRGAQPVDPRFEPVAPAQSPLWGLGRVLAQELPELSCTLVDLGSEDAPADIQPLFEELWSNERENQIALRGAMRYVARLLRFLPEAAPAGEQPLLRQDGTYLITGGLGGLGLTIARWMAEQGAGQLVLVGRSAAAVAAQEQLTALEQAGTQVAIISADVAQDQQVAELFAQIDRTLPPLRGIVHCAGVLDDGILLQLNQERLRAVMAPKVAGAWNLHLQTSNRQLDFFVLFSSAAALLGSPGQGNYAAANAFLDALAHYRQVRGLPALSINWGPWAEVGGAAQPERGGRLASQGIASIEPKRGAELFGKLLRQRAAQVVVLQIDWPTFGAAYPAAGSSSLLGGWVHGRQDELLEPGDQQQGQAPNHGALLTAEPGEGRHMLVEYLREQVAMATRRSSTSLDIQSALNLLGVDSLRAIELKNRVEADLGLTVPVVMFLEGASVAQLAAQLLDRLVAEHLLAAIHEPGTDPAASDGEWEVLSI